MVASFQILIYSPKAVVIYFIQHCSSVKNKPETERCLFWVAIQCRPELLKMQTVSSPDSYVLMSVHDSREELRSRKLGSWKVVPPRYIGKPLLYAIIKNEGREGHVLWCRYVLLCDVSLPRFLCATSHQLRLEN
jgi:hypothetical protein